MSMEYTIKNVFGLDGGNCWGCEAEGFQGERYVAGKKKSEGVYESYLGKLLNSTNAASNNVGLQVQVPALDEDAEYRLC
ncbi:hypothetical protein Tco_1504115 [Tanacetum coccineum]